MAVAHFRHLTAAAVLYSLACGPVAAEEQPAANPHEHMNHEAAQAPTDGKELSDGSKALEAAMQKMHKSMAVPYTNDIDVDFVRGMIPHHQGAIDQAEVLLKFSKNPRLRRLAGGIIAAQRREIRFMQKWLAEHDKGAESNEMPDWLKNNPTTPEDATAAGAKD
jgi:uncharacterized protein (DUF305 family)